MNEIATVLTNELALPSISEALPADFNKARFVQNTVSLIQDNKDLAKYPQAKLVPGLLKGAYLGLDFFNKECYLIPYGDDLRFQIDYKGMQKLVKKYAVRPVDEIYARLVREGDEFNEEIRDNEPVINFKPKPFNDGKIIGAFAVCQYKDGGAKVETMNKEQLDAAKRMSQTQGGTAWKYFPEEMYKKVIIRRLCKGIPVELENSKQDSLMHDEPIESDAKVIDVEEEVNPFQ
jgi:recombination protein RecT